MKYALFRYPMAPSLSPQIHESFAKQCHLSIHYTQIAVSPSEFPQALQQFRLEGGQGANVTMPLKEIAYTLCSHTTARARQAKSVNTLYWINDELWGDTTDGAGFIAAMQYYPTLTFTDKTILLLGAGGVAGAILDPLLQQNPLQLLLANRSLDRAKHLAHRYPNAPITVLPYEALCMNEQHFDWIINATPIQQPDQSWPLSAWQMKNGILVELTYAKTGGRTPLAEWALASGASQVIDGLGMLIAQAAESFKIWHPGTSPDPKSVFESLILRP